MRTASPAAEQARRLRGFAGFAWLTSFLSHARDAKVAKGSVAAQQFVKVLPGSGDAYDPYLLRLHRVGDGKAATEGDRAQSGAQVVAWGAPVREIGQARHAVEERFDVAVGDFERSFTGYIFVEVDLRFRPPGQDEAGSHSLPEASSR